MKLPLNMEHHITWKNVCVCLGSNLCIHAVEYVFDLSFASTGFQR